MLFIKCCAPIATAKNFIFAAGQGAAKKILLIWGAKKGDGNLNNKKVVI